MIKRIFLLEVLMIVFVSSVFANSNSKLSYESRVGFSSDKITYKLLDENDSTKDLTFKFEQSSISISENIKYDSDYGYNYIANARINFPFSVNFDLYSLETKNIPLDSSFFQKSINIFLGVEKVFDFSSNVSLDFVTGVDGTYFFDNKSENSYIFESDKISSSILSFGIFASLDFIYNINSDLKFTLGLNTSYNPILYGEVVSGLKLLTEIEPVIYKGSFYSINPYIGIGYRL